MSASALTMRTSPSLPHWLGSNVRCPSRTPCCTLQRPAPIKGYAEGLGAGHALNTVGSQACRPATTFRLNASTAAACPELALPTTDTVLRPPTAYKSGAVVVGGGPAGLATAMMLARRGWTDITVVEKRPGLDIEETDKSYSYMLDGRGQSFLSTIPGLAEAVSRTAVNLDGAVLTTITGDGQTNTKKLNIKSEHYTAQWLFRSKLLQMLHDEGLVPGREQGWGRHIDLRTGCSVVGVDREANSSGGWQLSLTVEDLSTGQQEVLRPHLVVGADGIHSTVRQTLQQWAREDGHSSDSQFGTAQLDAASADLKFKVLRLPANPVLSTAPGSAPVANTSMAVVHSRKGLPPSRRLKLGLMPVSETSTFRTANLIMPRDGHELLNVTTPEEFYKFIEDVFPQLPVRDLVPVEEATRFVNSRGGAFPHPQYVQGMQMSSPAETDQPATDYQTTANQEPLQGYGVVLLGDARAAFPPDMGQGVNSAFEDVMRLEQALDACGDNVAKALPSFEATRLPEIKALVSLAQFGNPYQYSQDLVKKGLWAANFLLRLVLNKLAPWWFSPQTFLMVQDSSLSYAQVLTRAHATTQRMVALACVLAVGVTAQPALADMVSSLLK